MSSRHVAFSIGGQIIRPNRITDLRLKVSESYTGDDVTIPLRVIRAKTAGPCVFVTAAVHGNEINGTGIIHEMMADESLALRRGTLILIPIVNAFGFEAQTRYMPDRRDLNRSFPGRKSGSLSSRVAHTIFQEIVRRCDYGIDLHSAASQRMNLPNIRADFSDRGAAKLAKAFGCELMVNGKGPEGSLRREACAAGCATIILEAGEPSKIEPTVLRIGCQGIRNVLIALEMLKGEQRPPTYQAQINRTTWVRAQVGGILRFHVTPGETVVKGQPLATNASVFGVEQNVLRSPVDGIVLSMATLPTVKPGEPVCHLAIPRISIDKIRIAQQQVSSRSLHEQVRRDLASNIPFSNHADQTPIKRSPRTRRS
jgi:predicted deacylase